MVPNFPSAASTAARACAASVTSSDRNARRFSLPRADRSLARLRAVATTRCPASSAALTMPAPMPLLLPVTNQTLFVRMREEDDPELLLELLDRLTDRRGGHAEFARRAAEVAKTGDGEKDLELRERRDDIRSRATGRTSSQRRGKGRACPRPQGRCSGSSPIRVTSPSSPARRRHSRSTLTPQARIRGSRSARIPETRGQRDLGRLIVHAAQ